MRHQLRSILALAAAAVVGGARSYVVVGLWAANAPQAVLAALQVRRDLRTGEFVVPTESTIRRVLQACDGDGLDAVLGAWLYPRLPAEHSSWTARRSAAPGPAMGERCTCWPPCSPDPAP
jgi:hypothetical protein